MGLIAQKPKEMKRNLQKFYFSHLNKLESKNALKKTNEKRHNSGSSSSESHKKNMIIAGGCGRLLKMT